MTVSIDSEMNLETRFHHKLNLVSMRLLETSPEIFSVSTRRAWPRCPRATSSFIRQPQFPSTHLLIKLLK